MLRCSLLLIVAPALALPAVAEERPLNQPPEGFVALFNGQDLSGWKGLVRDPKSRAEMTAEELQAAQEQADASMREHWKVVDGILVFDGKGENLCTQKDYGNFELYVDWKIEPKGDSGIYLRGSPQVQIWDAEDADRNRVGSGGLFNNQKHPSTPLVQADHPVGEWNTFFIRMVGDRVSIKLNDKLVVDNVVMENYWERDKPIYPTGAIELQNHGNTLYFRNIFVRELPEDADSASLTRHEWKTLFDGKSLEQWDYTEGGWSIDENGDLARQDGVRSREDQNFIWSKERFGDFILDLEFKMSPGCNSGIFIRTDDRDQWLHSGIEVQIIDSHERQELGKHDCGAVYDIMAPRVNAALPPGEWNKIRIVAQDSLLSVKLNGKRVADLDLNDWTEAGQNPDGTPNKFKTAYRDLQREGFIGFQDHGHPVWFRNVRIKPLEE